MSMSLTPRLTNTVKLHDIMIQCESVSFNCGKKRAPSQSTLQDTTHIRVESRALPESKTAIFPLTDRDGEIQYRR